MRAYLDSSALIKRGVTESHSEPLREVVDDLISNGATPCSSTLAWIEVNRALRARFEPEDPRRVIELIDASLSGIDEVPLARQVTNLARRVGAPAMRSLDAIHLASAVAVDADLFIGYDKRLLVVAEEMGFRTVSPGVD